MEPTFDSLVTILEGQKEIYRDLVSLGKTKQVELVKGSIEELDAMTRREEALIFQAGRLEEERYRCTCQLLENNGLNKDTPLREIIDVAPQQIKEKLEQVHGDMVDLLTQMDKLNRENMNLIQQSLDFIQVTIESVSQETQATYTAGHDVKAENLSRLLDKKV